MYDDGVQNIYAELTFYFKKQILSYFFPIVLDENTSHDSKICSE